MNTTSRALAFASRWFDAATVNRVFEPLIADWQREWRDAPAARRTMAVMRGFVAFAVTFIVLAPRQWLLTPIPAGIARRVILRMAAFMAVACALSAMLFMSTREASPQRLAWLFALVLPSLIALVLPFATAFVVDTIRARREPSQEERLLMARVAVTASLFVFIFGGWVVPHANQRLRIETRGFDVPAPLKGVRELTTYELIFKSSLTPEREPFTGLASRDRRIRAEVQNRIYLVTLPLLLVWIRWKALAQPRKEWLHLPAALSAGLTFVSVMTLYLGGWIAERTFELPAGISSWLTLGALAAWGLATPHRRRIVLLAIERTSRLSQAFHNSRIP